LCHRADKIAQVESILGMKHSGVSRTTIATHESRHPKWCCIKAYQQPLPFHPYQPDKRSNKGHEYTAQRVKQTYLSGITDSIMRRATPENQAEQLSKFTCHQKCDHTFISFTPFLKL
jgi:hypothetical protein